MLGWGAEELVGKEIHPIVHHTHHDGRTYPDHDCPIYAAFPTAPCIRSTAGVLAQGPAAGLGRYTSTPIRDRGVVVGAVIVFRDVSQRREADEKLHAALAEVGPPARAVGAGKRLLQEEIRIETNPRGIIAKRAIQKTLRQVKLWRRRRRP